MNRATFVVIVGIAGSGLVATLAACSGRNQDEAAASNAAPLVRAELPRSVSLAYDMSQPELGGPTIRERVTIAVAPSGRRMTLVKDYGGREERHEVQTDRLGGVDKRTSPNARWHRLEVFSTPAMVGKDQHWEAPLLRDLGAGIANTTDHRRAFQVVRTWDVPGGRRSRAIFNVRGMIDETTDYARAHRITNENWPLRESVFAVGIADYFTSTKGAEGETFLLSSAEYRFTAGIPSGELAVTSLETLKARLESQETLVTLRCLVDGPAELLATMRATRDDQDAHDLTLCFGK